MQAAHINDKMKEGHVRWFCHVLCRPLDVAVCTYENMVIEGVKKDKVVLELN